MSLTPPGPFTASCDTRPWPTVKFQVPPAWLAELDKIAGERAISRADLGRMIFREWLAPRLSA